MASFIFSLGIINKKLLLPFLVSINQILLNVINYFYSKNQLPTCDIMDAIAVSFGQMSILFIPLFLKYKRTTTLKEAICNKKNMKHQVILWVGNAILLALIGVSSLTANKNESNLNNPHVNILCTREAVEMIFLAIVTIFVLKYKYYIHHVISLIIFCAISVIIDILIDNFKAGLGNKSAVSHILEILTILAEIFNYCYHAYLMSNLYYNYWSIVFSLGLFLFGVNIIMLITIFCFGKNSEGPKFFTSFFDYFDKVQPGFVILRFALEYIFFGFTIQTLRILTLKDLTTNHMLISYEISKLSNILLNSTHKYKWYTLIPFVFQFISLMFFLEVFEFNFCDLNKNTRKNIQIRENKDMDMRDSINSNNYTEIKGYLIENDNDINDEKNIIPEKEMREMNDK